MNTYSTNSEHPSPTAANLRAIPGVSATAPPFRSSSPTAGFAPNPWTHRESNNYASVFSNVDKPPVIASGPYDRFPALDRADSRTTPKGLAGLMQDHDMLRSRSSPHSTLQREHSQSSTSSPVSSGFSSNTAPLQAPPSSITSLTANAEIPSATDALATRRLPPLSAIVEGPPEPGPPSAMQAKDRPSLRPGFSPASHTSSTVSAPASVVPPARGLSNSFESVNVQPNRKDDYDPNPRLEQRPSFKGEYNSPRLEQRPSFKGEYNKEAFVTSLGPDADPLSVLAYAGRLVDKEEGLDRRKKGGSSSGVED